MKELLYRKIYLELKAGITAGDPAPGERLPGVREIADSWGTSPNTILKALAALESDGLITKTRGQGIFVNERGRWEDRSEEPGELAIILHDMDDPFNLRLLSAVEKSAAARGYKLTVGSSIDSISAAADGLIVVPESAASFIRIPSGRAEIPVVYTGRFSPPRDFSEHYIIADVYSGFFHAAQLLVEAGRQRIAYIGSGRDADGDPGCAAVIDVLAGTRFGFRREYAAAAEGYDAEQGRAAMDGILLNDEFPDAVICASDTLAAGALKACLAAGLNVPSDISVIGSGDQDIAPLLDPPLTSLRVPAELLGIMAAGFMDDIIRGRLGVGGKVRSRLDPELIIRGSALSGAAEAGAGGDLMGADGIAEASGDESLWL